jgi:hypothetical protein
MRKPAFILAASAVIVAGGVTFAAAQQDAGGSMMQRQDQKQAQHEAGHEGMPGEPAMMGRGMMGQENMMDMMGHRMGRGMSRPTAMMGGPFMMRIVFILMDSNGDGAISLQEFQTAHERIFKAMDSNKDGSLTLDEMQAFMHGNRPSMPVQ